MYGICIVSKGTVSRIIPLSFVWLSHKDNQTKEACDLAHIFSFVL